MSKTKVTAIVEPCESREEFESTIDQIARLDVQAQKLSAALKQKHQDIDDKYGAEAEDIRLWTKDREKYDAIFAGRRDVKVTQEDNFWVEPKADDQVK